jgi:hypothetical protein
MEVRRPHPVSVVALAFVMLAAGCAGRRAKPRTVAALGGLAVAGGSIAWASGEGLGSDSPTGEAFINAGFVGVALGLATVVVAGGWMALAVSCDADPDCDEDEQCREIPAPPGGVPYKQCMSR